MKPEEMDRQIDEHFRFEATDDIEGVLSTLTDDVDHDIVGLPGGAVHRREDARRFYEDLFKDLSESRVQKIRRYYGDHFMVDESLWSGRAPGRPFGFEGRNRPLKFRLLHVLEFAGDGRIKRENVWLDFAAIVQQLS